MKNYKTLVMYVIFGACTTIVSIVSYYVLYKIVHFSNVASVITAWFIAVAFAFITNKLFVFESKTFNKRILVYEIWTFFSCRITTGILDTIIMYTLVDLLQYDALFSKLISEIAVNLLNYIASKIIVFRKNEKVNS